MTKKHNQKGKGLISSSALNLGKRAVNKALVKGATKASSKAGRTVVNKLTDSDLREGERHPPMIVKGKIKYGNYLGPGSHVVDKMKEGKKGISEVDNIAFRHDLAYLNAENEADIREADKHMIKALDKVQKEKGDSLFNIYSGKMGIRAKMKLEDMGVSPKRFTSFGEYKELSPEDQKLAKDTLDKLTQEGYGKQKKNMGKRKSNDWITHCKKYHKSHPNLSWREVLVKCKKSYRK